MKLMTKLVNEEFQGIEANLSVDSGYVTVVCNFPYKKGYPSRWAGLSMRADQETGTLSFYDSATTVSSVKGVTFSEMAKLVRAEIDKVI
jgi:hypothetical protein